MTLFTSCSRFAEQIKNTLRKFRDMKLRFFFAKTVQDAEKTAQKSVTFIFLPKIFDQVPLYVRTLIQLGLHQPLINEILLS